jgi:nicotinate-nucleotide adenylyltransferase
MVRLAIADNPLFVLDERETHRGGPSYTFDTLTQLRTELGAATPLIWIMGLDAFLRFDHWHRWCEIFDFAHVAVAHRPGAALSVIGDTALAAEFAARRVADVQALSTQASGCVAVVPIPLLEISATAIRAAMVAGRSAKYWLPDAVIDYIHAQQLFLQET